MEIEIFKMMVDKTKDEMRRKSREREGSQIKRLVHPAWLVCLAV